MLRPPPRRLSRLLFLAAFAAGGASAQEGELVLADFEGTAYPPDWQVTGTAFGAGPARGTLPDQQVVSGMAGAGYLSSYHGRDGSRGTLTLPPFTVSRPYLNFLVGGGNRPGEAYVELVVDGQAVRSATGAHSEAMAWLTWDLSSWQGRTARIRIVDEAAGDWGHILADAFSQGSVAKAHQEARRPQFHFSAHRNWINDPNGLVFYKGEYHLFYQHNPFGNQWGNMTWGHAVSPDLIHWEHLPVAIPPDDARCTAYSGSALVDWENAAGLQQGGEKTLIIFWTSFGCGQRMAYSNDRGRTWTKLPGAVVPQEGEARDPKVFWHAPSRRFVMVVWTDARGGGAAIYTSPDLRAWTFRSQVPDLFECPDLFELAVDGGATRKWVLHGADRTYRIGSFDGAVFTAESGPHTFDWGRHWWAAQSWSDIPAADGRRITITWMRDASFPDMPFNGQMGIPSVFALKTLPEGVRMVKNPVREIEVLRTGSRTWKDLPLAPGQNPLAGVTGELLDVVAEFEPGTAAEVGLKLRGTTLAYKVAARSLEGFGSQAPLAPVGGRVRIRALLDRASAEVYGNDGAVSFTNGWLPPGGDRSLEAYALGGAARLVSLEVHTLRGAWAPLDLAEAKRRAQNPTALAPAAPRAKERKWTPALVRRGAFDALGRLRR